MYTIDTNAIIYYLANESTAVDFFEEVAEQHLPVYVPGVVITELLSYQHLTDKDIRDIMAVVGFGITIHTNDQIVTVAGELRRRFKTKTIDALIAATALFTGSVLVTRNIKDFKPVPDLPLYKV